MNQQTTNQLYPSERTRAVLAAEHDLATLTGQITRSVIRDSKRTAAEWYSHQQNRETLLMIRRVVAAYAALKGADEMPTDFFTTRYLVEVSLQLVKTVEAKTGDPMGMLQRIYERERMMFGLFLKRDTRVLELARIDVGLGFMITNLLCLVMNYVRFLLKGGIFGRAISSTRIFAEIKELALSFAEVPAEVGKRVRPLGRQISRNTEAVNHLSRRFFGLQKDSRRERKRSNDFLVKKATAEYYRLLRKGVKERFALTDACRAVEEKYGLGDYKNFASFRNMVSRIIARK